MTHTTTTFTAIGTLLAAGALSLASTTASADQVFLDDVIVDGSLCVGFDCVNGESFGFDTLRLKENNLRIHFDDTSNSASFPNNDWRIVANGTNNGGLSFLGVEDATAGRNVFLIEAGARTNALYVEDDGDIGIGTATPAADLTIKTGNTPTVRLVQDGSSGFTPQTWDMAGNEANFFIRDATSGSTLPFRLFPGAPSNALNIEGTTGDIGIGTTSPDSDLDIEAPLPELRFTSTTAGEQWEFRMNGAGAMNLQPQGTGTTAMGLSNDATAQVLVGFDTSGSTAAGAKVADQVSIVGNLTVTGDINSDGTTVVPDYVFAPDYELMPLYDVEAFITEHSHLPRIPSAADVEANGLNMTKMQMALLEKVEELTLHTIAQQKMIDELRAELAAK